MVADQNILLIKITKKAALEEFLTKFNFVSFMNQGKVRVIVNEHGIYLESEKMKPSDEMRSVFFSKYFFEEFRFCRKKDGKSDFYLK